jgi:hypothetical protein
MTIDEAKKVKKGDRVWVAQNPIALLTNPSIRPAVFAGEVVEADPLGCEGVCFLAVLSDRNVISTTSLRAFLTEAGAVAIVAAELAALRRWCDAVEASLRSPIVPVGKV